jgi:hypothetical protein
VRVVAVSALDLVFKHRMVRRKPELRFYFLMTREAKIRIFGLSHPALVLYSLPFKRIFLLLESVKLFKILFLDLIVGSAVCSEFGI